MKHLIFLIIGILIYLYICYRSMSINYWKYILKSYLWILILMIILWFSFSEGIDSTLMLFFIILFLIGVFILNSCFYVICKNLKKDDLENEAKQLQQEIEKQENLKLETIDMKKIKTLLKEIPLRINQLNNFDKELQIKINDLELMAKNAISQAYGEFMNQDETTNCIKQYKQIYDKYSNQVDSILLLQCDKIVSKISNKIEEKQQIIEKNSIDKQKYFTIEKKLQKQYDKELKIQKMNNINNQLNQLSEQNSDLETAFNDTALLEKTIEEFSSLNLEVESRRELEIKLSKIEI